MELEAQCDTCAALCCKVYAFEAEQGFRHRKPPGVACVFLDNGACSTHTDRAGQGMAPCVTFTCNGAGQTATRLTEGRGEAETARAFHALMPLHRAAQMVGEAERLWGADAQLAALAAELRPEGGWTLARLAEDPGPALERRVKSTLAQVARDRGSAPFGA